MTKDEIIEIAKTCETRTQFRTIYRTAAHHMDKNGWSEEVLSSIQIRPRSSRTKPWSDEELLNLALQFRTRKDFAAAHPTQWQAVHKRRLTDTHFAHMDVLGNIDQKYVYSIENVDLTEVYVGITNNPNKRIKEHRFRNVKLIESFGGSDFKISKISTLMSAVEAQLKEKEWVDIYYEKGWRILNSAKTGALGARLHDEIDKEEAKRRALKYETLMDFRKNEPYTYVKSKHNGWFEEIASHLKRKYPVITMEECRTEAMKWSTRGDFQTKGRRRFYECARRNGWLDEICSHMSSVKFPKTVPRGHWCAKDNCAIAASKYSTRISFQKENVSAYIAAKKNGWLDEICSHMPREKRGRKRKNDLFAPL